MRRGVRLKHVKAVRKPDGKTFLYYAKPGHKLVRLPDLPENHSEFIRAYGEAATTAGKVPSVRVPREGTVAALVVSYKESPEFRGLRSSTREMRARILDKIAERGKDALTKDLRARHIDRDLSDISPHAANSRLKVWRALMKEARRKGWIETDPSREVEKRKTPKGGHKPWPPELITQYRAHHAPGTEARLVFELAFWTSARRSDLVRMGRQMVGNDGWLSYIQMKTGGPVSVPLLSPLPRWMAPLRHDHELVRAEIMRVSGQMLFIAKRNGSGRSAKAFSTYFAALCQAAGLPPGYTVHGLRKSRLTILAELGWSEHQLASWGGHASLSEVAEYTRTASRKRTLMGTEQDQNFGNSG